MGRLLRSDLEEFEVYVTRVAEFTGIPADHIEKDFWVTEVLRGVAATSRRVGCSIVFKGGTSLSKAHRLIQRFSEDVDLIAVLPAGGKGSRDTTLKAFMAGAAEATGLDAVVDGSSTTKGEKRSAVVTYPTSKPAGVLSPGVLIEIGTRGGALPQRRLAVQSLIVEHAESVGLPIDMLWYPKDALRVGVQQRIREGDPYFSMLRQRWGGGLRRVFGELPDPDWLE